jgi:hypothetical protein
MLHSGSTLGEDRKMDKNIWSCEHEFEWLDCDRGHAECYFTECTKCLLRDYDCEKQECTHTLCVEGTRRWDAKYVVTQLGFDAMGLQTYRWVTYACKAHTEVMRGVLREHDTVERLHGGGE